MSTSADDAAPVPEGASCWICRDAASTPFEVRDADGRPRAAGQPLVRDCSCRGTSGYAHFFCLAQYAVNKVSEGGDITKPFIECPLCNQEYQNELSVNMANVMIQFADQIDDIDPYRYAEALYTKLLAEDKVGKSTDEVKKTAREMIAKLEEVDEPSKCAFAANPTAHSNSAKNLKSLAYEKLAWQFVKEGVNTKGSEEEASEKFNLAVEHYNNYRNLAKLVGNAYHVKDAETKIARARGMDPLYEGEVKQDLKYLRAEYERDPSHLNSSNFINALRFEGHSIELERVVVREIVKNRRLLGPDHRRTQELELGLKNVVSVRELRPLNEDGTDKPGARWRFVRYEDDGAKFVAIPMKSVHDSVGGREDGEERECAFETAEMTGRFRLAHGTPVMCVGLAKAAHLNGEIGDARKYNKETKRYDVHFENQTLTPRTASVKMSNLQIVKDLPPK